MPDSSGPPQPPQPPPPPPPISRTLLGKPGQGKPKQDPQPDKTSFCDVHYVNHFGVMYEPQHPHIQRYCSCVVQV